MLLVFGSFRHKHKHTLSLSLSHTHTHTARKCRKLKKEQDKVAPVYATKAYTNGGVAPFILNPNAR